MRYGTTDVLHGVSFRAHRGEVLALLGLNGAGKTTTLEILEGFRTLSGGQRRRLDVAIGLVGRPELLFLDEPTAGFDPQARRHFHELISSVSTTILLTTHDLDEAARLADRIVILDHGRVLFDGTVTDLTGHAEVRWTLGGRRFTEATDEPTRFTYDLFRTHGLEIKDLEVRRWSLEDAYLSVVRGAAR